MGAFYLYKTGDKTIDGEKAKAAFTQKGFLHPQKHRFGGYSLLIYPKICGINNLNLLQFEDDLIFSSGTVLYKNCHRDMVLQEIYHDFISDRLDFNSLCGIFFIALYHRGELYFIHDKQGFFNVFYHTATYCISSSFLAIAESVKFGRNIDQIEVVSSLLSGFSVTHRTFYREINKLRVENGFQNNHHYQNSKLLNMPLNKEKSFRNRDDSIEYQLSLIEGYFEKIKCFLGGTGTVDIGLSGGFDSRLLLAAAQKKLLDYTIHSNYKNPPDRDLKISMALAEAVGKNLVTVEIRKNEDKDRDEIMENMQQALYFYDGQVRVNHGWSREYRTLNYRKKVLGDSILGLSGHNGEQYRNHDYFSGIPISVGSYIKNYLFAGLLKKLFKDKKFTEEIIDAHKKVLLPYADEKGRLNHSAVRRIYVHELVRGGPGIRGSIENQLSYYLIPFADWPLVEGAASITKYLGSFGSYEAAMIKKMSPVLAALQTNYGYSLDNIDITHKIKSHARRILPKEIENYYRNNVKGRKRKRGLVYSDTHISRLNIPVFTEELLRINDEHLLDRFNAINFLFMKEI